MFTGIIESLGKVKKVENQDIQSNIIIQTGFKDLEIGESVAINGICLTVVEISNDDALFFISNETINKTSLNSLKVDMEVNLERALTLSKKISGHIVQGHVDGTCNITKIDSFEDTTRFTFKLEKCLSKYCIEKGSISLDGISLTVCDLESDSDTHDKFTVYIIPHTINNTNLKDKNVGSIVNVEMDMMAKHLERLCLTANK